MSDSAWSLWEHGREPGRDVVALGAAAVLTVALADILLTGEVGFFFDLCFVALCLVLALRVAPGDFFVVGVLPPLVLLGAFTLLAIAQPAAIAHPDDPVIQAVVSGLAIHAVALTAGYALALAVLFWRTRELTRPR